MISSRVRRLIRKTLSREVNPLTMLTLLEGTRRDFATNATTAALAFPPSGGAVTRRCSTPSFEPVACGPDSWKPTTLDLEALGCTLTRRVEDGVDWL